MHSERKEGLKDSEKFSDRNVTGENRWQKELASYLIHHGLLRPEVISILKTCDCILHAGDVDRPEILDQLRYLGSLYVVRGNNDRDWAEKLSVTLRFKIEGTEFFMTHNKKDVAWDLGTAQVVIFGHSHHYFEKMIDGRLWLNPGSCGRSRFGGEVTMALMEIDNGNWNVRKISFSA